MSDHPSPQYPSLGPHYLIQGEIGRGGMAVVYLARDLRHDRPVAAKVLRPEYALVVGSDRFLREIRIEAGLQHPNILALLDSGRTEETPARPYYVMPLVEGESLRDRLEREGPLPVDEALTLTREVAEALAYAHAQGIVHRDIKPENLLLTRGHILVADFGVAHLLDRARGERLTEVGLLIGTPEYMSPEQCAGDAAAVDGRSDIYALACVLFEMLTGTPPLDGPTPQVVIARQLSEPPPSLETLRPAVGRQLASVVQRALAKAPSERYPSVEAFGSALAAARGKPEEPPPRPRAARWPLAGLLVVLAAVLLGYWWSASRVGQLDPNRVVVFPLLAESDNLDRRAGETAALMIGTTLTQAEPLYWDYGWRLLDERTRKDPRILTAAAARELTRRQGARYYIDGWVVLDADSLRVLLALHDAAGPDVPVTRQASARVGERTPTQLGLQAAVALLPSLLSHPVDLSPLTDRRPVAIAEFLLGEVEYFASRFGSALQHYQRALDTDSSLALAAVKGAQAAGWDDRLDESQVLADQALTHADLLPRRYVLMARGIHDYARGQADSATAWLTQATRMAPNWAEAWTGLGEVYYHLLPDASPIDSLAEGAFRRAYALDPSFTPPIYHLVQIAIRRSRLSEARDLLAQYQRIAPDTTVLQPLQLMLGCARRGMTRAAWVEAARQAAAAVTDAAVWLSSSPEYMGCAEQAFRAVMQDSMAHPNARAQAYFALQSLLAGSGRAAETRALASSEPGSRSGGWYFLLDALVDSAFDRDAAPVVEKAGEDYQAMSPGKLWFLGMWESHRADTVRLGRIAAQLTRKADSSGTARDRLLAEAIGAHLTLARGDTAAALDRLTRLRPVSGRTALAWLPPDGLGFERLVQARIHLQRGDAESALRVAAVFDSPAPVPFTLFRRASLTVRRAAAEAAGQRALARHFDEVLNQMPRVPKLP